MAGLRGLQRGMADAASVLEAPGMSLGSCPELRVRDEPPVQLRSPRSLSGASRDPNATAVPSAWRMHKKRGGLGQTTPLPGRRSRPGQSSHWRKPPLSRLAEPSASGTAAVPS